ncbi:MAG: hypothetical protein ACLQPD_25425 [Desulfomonilaceae bacterium]
MPETSTLFAGSQVPEHVFSRLDKFEASIPYTRENHRLLSDPARFWELIWETSELCGNTGGCYRAGQDKATRIFDYKVFRPYWQITINGYITRVSITLLRSVESRLPQEQTENHDYPRVLNAVHRDEAVVVLQERPLPSATELWNRGWFPRPQEQPRFMLGRVPPVRYLGHIRFTDQLKKLNSPYQWMPFSYRDDVLRILHLWEEFTGITLVPRNIEAAIDTWDRDRGTTLVKTILPRWFDPRELYHFRAGNSRKILGPSCESGNNEYSGYRRKARKVYHSYVKAVGHWERPLYRTEVQLHRTFIREYCAREGIQKALDLVGRVSQLAADHLRFAKLDFDKVYSRIPDARKWKLRRFSTRGQIYILQLRYCMPRKLINRYLVPTEEPILTDLDVYNLY